ncbi:MAG: hypothetical protein CH6_0733 [Candidatus Kapaibacterium sp.]|nr:MAG: hypothetical protein CH6_0733 [Candidatus Kapabacteria bacterium]
MKLFNFYIFIFVVRDLVIEKYEGKNKRYVCFTFLEVLQ